MGLRRSWRLYAASFVVVAALGVGTACVRAQPRPEGEVPAAPTRSDRLALSADGSTLFVVNPDSASVSRLDTASFAVSEYAVCDEPQSVAFTRDEAQLLVTCRTAGALCALNSSAPETCRMVAVGHMPYGVAVSPSDGRVVVSNEGEGSLSLLDARAQSELARLALSDTPRAIAISGDGRRAFVSHFLTRGDSGRVSAVDLADGSVRSLELAEDPGPDDAGSGRGFPNLLSVLAISPDGSRLWVGGLKSNTARGEYLSGEALLPDHRVRGLFAPLDLASGRDLVSQRIDTVHADSVSGVAFSPTGRYAYLLHQGAARLSVYDLAAVASHDASGGEPAPATARLDVGHAPQGIVLAPDGLTAYVMAYLDQAVEIVDLSEPAAPRMSRRVSVTGPPLQPGLLRGKRLFFRSRGPEHSAHDYIACASCHPEGGHDGRVWDLTQFGEGLRNTIDLRGRAGTAHGPVHWSANFDEIQDFENDIVHGFGGSGLAADGEPPHAPLGGTPNSGRSQALDDLALYVWALITYPPSPFRQPDGTLSGAALRGRTIFFEPSRRCAVCHLPPRFTDSTLSSDPEHFVLHDVGTLRPGSGGRLGGPLAGIDTPSLNGAWAGAPYLHDGSAATLREVLAERNREDRHGATSDLSAAQLDDLVAYLLSLDGSHDAVPPGFRAQGEPERDGGRGPGRDAQVAARRATPVDGDRADLVGCSAGRGRESAPLPGVAAFWAFWLAIAALRARVRGNNVPRA